MKFKPRQPREGINVSDEHPLVEAGTLIVGLSALFALVAIVIVFFVDFVLVFVPPQTEADLFSDWSPDDTVSLEIDDERETSTRALLGRLSQHWPDSPFLFRLEVSESDDSNAMAFPGGLIVVTTALLDQVESENELAFVLGHELGHYRNRDHIRQLGRGIAFSMLLAALGIGGADDLGISVTEITMRGFSREQESEADEFGLEIVQAEYGHVGESWRFFERVIRQDGNQTDLVIYLSSHPDLEERIDELKEYATNRGWSLSGQIRPLAW